MLVPSFTTQFKRDLKLMERRGKDTDKFKTAATLLIEQKALAPSYKNHKLSGNYAGRWECHLEPNWLLVYKLSATEIVFERTGTHADLFE
jgi:mRNA interferase YafQ